jgi:hypothetical protein
VGWLVKPLLFVIRGFSECLTSFAMVFLNVVMGRVCFSPTRQVNDLDRNNVETRRRLGN